MEGPLSIRKRSRRTLGFLSSSGPSSYNIPHNKLITYHLMGYTDDRIKKSSYIKGGNLLMDLKRSEMFLVDQCVN